MSDIFSGSLIFNAARVLIHQAAPTLTLPVTEPWAVADSPGTLNGTYSWVQFVGGTGWSIRLQGAELTGQLSNTQAARLNGNLGTSNFRATVVYDAWSPAGSGVLAGGPAVRMQPDGSFTYYTAPLVNVGGPTQLYLFAFVAGAQYTLGGPVSVTPHTGMTVSLAANGSAITAVFDGTTLLTAPADPRIPTGAFGGIQGVASGANLVRFGSWNGSAIVHPHLPPEWLGLGALLGVG